MKIQVAPARCPHCRDTHLCSGAVTPPRQPMNMTPDPHVAEFMAQVPRHSPPQWVRASDLFAQFQQWRRERGLPPCGHPRTLGSWLLAQGYQRKRSNGYWYAL